MPKQDAINLVNAFSQRQGTSMWPNIRRADLSAGLTERINDPNKIDQKDTSFCGPSCFIRSIASDHPEAYAQAAINLFETGSAQLRGMALRPRREIRDTDQMGGTNPADFILLASLRDSDNIWLSPVGRWPEFASMTMPEDIEMWFRRAGYSKVVSVTSLTRITNLPPGLLRQSLAIASTLFDKGWKVVMLIDSDVLKSATQDNSSLYPDHWVALASHIDNVDDEDAMDWPVNFKVFTWGEIRRVPVVPNSLDLDDFVRFYYGFVAAKP